MSLTLWIKHKLRKTSSPSKQTAFAEPSTCVWSCAPELIGGRFLCPARGHRSWETPGAGHREFSTLCKGKCQTLGQEARPEIPKSRPGNNAVICHENPRQGRKAARTGMGWCCSGSCHEPLPGWALPWGMAGAENRDMKGRGHQGRMMAPEQTRPALVSCKRCPKPSLHLWSAVSSWAGARLWRLGWVFLKPGGTLGLNWNYSVPKQPNLNGNSYTCSWQTALSKDTIKLSHRRPKTSVLMLSTLF